MRTLVYNLENTTLPSPVTTQVLRIVPVEWTPMNSVPCLRLEAFGCPASQGMLHLHGNLSCMLEIYLVILSPLYICMYICYVSGAIIDQYIKLPFWIYLLRKGAYRDISHIIRHIT